jgi:hypothetical protein
VEFTSGDIQVAKESQKQGVFERRVSTSASLRVWKHRMRCHNENWSGKFFYLPYRGVSGDSHMRQVIIFNNVGVL